MFEFRWSIPGQTVSHEARLRIHARNGWIGRKTFHLGDRPVYRRGRFCGIDHAFPHPEDAKRTVVLQAIPSPDGRQWAPELRLDGKAIPEQTGSDAPPVPDRPLLLSLATGLSYLIMFMLLIMLPHIQKTLYATLCPSHTRVFTVHVDDDTPPGLSIGPPRLLRGRVDEPYRATLSADGGTPPFRWEHIKGKLPPGISFAPQSATFTGTPTDSGDSVMRFRLTDGNDQKTERPVVLSIAAIAAIKPPRPRILDMKPPPGRVGRPFEASFAVEGGQPPHRWALNKPKLPKGLSFHAGDDGLTARLSGTPESAGWYPIRMQVSDSSYTPAEHTAPWIVPFLVTSVCLLGYWNMRRRSVVAFGALIAAQVVIGLYPDPVLSIANHIPWCSMTSYPFHVVVIAPQLILLGIGVANYRRMR